MKTYPNLMRPLKVGNITLKTAFPFHRPESVS